MPKKTTKQPEQTKTDVVQFALRMAHAGVSAIKTLPTRLMNINRLTIAGQLYLGIGFIVAMSLATSIVSWFLFGRIGSAQSYVNERSIPQLVAAFGVAQRSSVLVNAAPRLVTANDAEDLQQISEAVKAEQSLFSAQMSDLLDAEIVVRGDATIDDDEQAKLTRMHLRGEALINNIELIRETVAERLKLQSIIAQMRSDLVSLQHNITKTLVPEIDNQHYFSITGYRNLGESGADLIEYRSEGSLLKYRNLASLQEAASIGVTVLSNAFDIGAVSLLGPQRERFEAINDTIERNQARLSEDEVYEKTAAEFAQLFKIGLGDGNVFAVREEDITLADYQRRLLSRNRQLAKRLVLEAEELAAAARLGAAEANQSSRDAVSIGGRALVILGALSIFSALLVAWIFVGRFLVRRLEWLAERMRQMAEGDLAQEISMRGHDEVADMAAALEVFRQSSLKSQRVDVAERLAAELNDKNEELQSVLGELKTAQDQIVMREKLAALGELTAGVAHEIKNPLNFIKNFSEMTGELVDELKEVVDEFKDKISNEQWSLVDELSGDLKGNAERVRSHAERANRIVHDMLSMGRGGGERQPTDINTLLDEHVRLAFHSARATDPNFQLHIEQDLDPDVGEANVIPQDLGRLFLNLVGNACYATNKRRKQIIEEAGPDDDDDEVVIAPGYLPTLSVKSEKIDDHFAITVKDNGCGIPKKNIAKIFNPFFTTKPTDQGTGLGLALSSDIIRAHGGSIKVDSKVNEFTEMTATFPFNQPEKIEPLTEDSGKKKDEDAAGTDKGAENAA